MTASQKPKTLSMTMKVRRGVSPSDIDMFCKKATRLPLSHIVDRVVVKERLAVNGNARSKEFTIELAFYPKDHYQKEYDVQPSEILAAFATKFPLLLRKEIQIEMKKLDADLRSQMKELGKGTTVRDADPVSRADGIEDDGDGANEGQTRRDDEVSEVGDGDATAAKRQRQTKEQATYEDEDENDEEAITLGELDDAEIEAAFASAGEDEDVEMDVDEDTAQTQARKRLSEEVAQVENLFMDNIPEATMFSFHESGCTVGLQVGVSRLFLGALYSIPLVRFFYAETAARRDRGENLCQNGHP